MSGASWEVGESAHVERCHVPGRSGDVSQEKAGVVCQMKRWGVSQAEGVGTEICPRWGVPGRGSGDVSPATGSVQMERSVVGRVGVPWKGSAPAQQLLSRPRGQPNLASGSHRGLAHVGGPDCPWEVTFQLPPRRPSAPRADGTLCLSCSHFQTEAVTAEGEVLHQRIAEVPGRPGGAASAPWLRHLRERGDCPRPSRLSDPEGARPAATPACPGR